MTHRSTSWRSSLYLLGYAMIYAVSLFLMHRVEHFGLSEPLLLLTIVGVGFSVFAWSFTRWVVPLPFAVRQPGREMVLLAAYLVAVAAFIAWGLGAIENGIRIEPLRSVVVLGAKLAVLVLVPLGLFRELWGYGIRDFLFPSTEWRRMTPALWMALVLILFQLVFGRGLAEIRHSGLPAWALVVGAPLAYAWLLIEVGLVEEFFFRALLQSRLSAWLRSEAGGIVLTSLLFGLAHAPGLH